MVKLIGWTFILLAPFMLGAFVPIVLNRLLGYDIYNILGIYWFIWVLLFLLWFEDSKYQLSL